LLEASPGIDASEIAALGITNQRETCLAWNPKTGKSYGQALVWQDTRTNEFIDELEERFGSEKMRKKTGLPLATYFSASKMKWILDQDSSYRSLARSGDLVLGTIDSYILWQLSGGAKHGVLYTDISNASRYLLMNIETLEWDAELLELFDIPQECLAKIVPSIPESPYAMTSDTGPFGIQIPLAGILGDQQAALFGQACYAKGESKNTYGTGCFMLMNTGEELVQSKYGLLTTPAYQIGNQKVVYALEGSVAIAGSLVQWIRDNLHMIKDSPEIEQLARSVEDSGGVYFVPAFSGLFAPYWKTDARGAVLGLTSYVNSGHIARAVLESTAFQTADVFQAMKDDSGLDLSSLKVDGGMVVNELLMQFQADILNIPVLRPKITETTALGAAYAAGLSVGFWKDQQELAQHWQEDRRWKPQMNSDERSERKNFWNKAIQRSMDWLD
jgi:glycerol kinase